MASRCPYAAGAEFVIILTDPVDHSTCHVRLKVVKACVPFTKSQPLKVDILGVTPGYETKLPQTAFLKLYDRRYLDDRAQDGRHPWNQRKESKAEEINRRVQSRFPTPELLVKNTGPTSPEREQEMLELIYFDEDDYEDELDSLQADRDAINQWIIEMRYRSKTMSWFYTECQAYRQLQALQGTSIPRFYGTTLFDETCEMPSGIESEVLGILLECVDGTTLEDILDTESCLTSHPYIGQAAVDCFDKITQFGVLHGDVRLANLMINISGRVYLIDFAFASFRPAHVVDRMWDQRVSEQQESYQLKLLLHKKGLRDRTPVQPYSDYQGSYWFYNRLLEKEREDWRLKYYQPSDFEHSVLRGEFDGKRCTILLPKWLPDYKAIAERKTYLNQLAFNYRQGFDQLPSTT
jgi:serine/threonine protein kinase